MSTLQTIRTRMREAHIQNEAQLLTSMAQASNITEAQRAQIKTRAVELVEAIRADNKPALLEVFLAEYGLSTDEGIALMCLAEALMRVPDARTMDELIEDKIAPSAWHKHLGNSDSLLVNASTWGLMLTGKVLDDAYNQGLSGLLKGMVKKLGEPVIRTAVKRAMKELGNQFVLGETIAQAKKRGKKAAQQGYTFSYDMLGEAALTQADATKFYRAYEKSINYLAESASPSISVAQNPGISIKLSALHPRYEVSQSERVKQQLSESLLSLALLAKNANMGLNVDAEEADRLDLSLDIIETVLRDDRLQGWDGFGVVVQAYGKRAALVIDWLYALATECDRNIMVRLVKGAYWDHEIKRSQTEGLQDFPVYTKKAATDCAYHFCAEKLIGMTDRIYPQFATHNAITVAAILTLADHQDSFEFQRLHGMGEVLHRLTLDRDNVRCRIYAPVGPHRDLLAYLVRRLLENGANSSFVNQIVDESESAEKIAQDPLSQISGDLQQPPAGILWPENLYGANRRNAKGWDLHNCDDLQIIDSARQPFRTHQWQASPILNLSDDAQVLQVTVNVINPANHRDIVGVVTYANESQAEQALANAIPWQDTSVTERADALRAAADLYEASFGELFAVLTREAGKIPADAIGELREAVDFLRYYASEAENLCQNTQSTPVNARGVVTCISPWNFPLAIFTGQIAAALAAGNAVLAKPAEQTSLCAFIAVQLLHKAGVPVSALQLLPGTGAQIGAKLVSGASVQGVCFTGSTITAQKINQTMAEHAAPDAPLIAETGGLNAMIVDSTALPEQAIKDVVASAFQSAGQRCSALRVLYLQKDIADTFLTMLFGAMDELVVADPWHMSTDIGPVIDTQAQQKITAHIAQAKTTGRLLKQLTINDDLGQNATFIPPTVLKIDGIADLQEEIFGPVLHVATFTATQLDEVIDAINQTGFGLTFGLHTRIDSRASDITSRLNVGNMYVNRNQIGAIVGSQPFGGEGLSGTGPKAGGPHYLPRFLAEVSSYHHQQPSILAAAVNANPLPQSQIQAHLSAAKNQISAQMPSQRHAPIHIVNCPGPTGESNQLGYYPRGVILCLGPTFDDAQAQAKIALDKGCYPAIITPDAADEYALSGFLPRDMLSQLQDFDAVVIWSDSEDQRAIRRALAKRTGAILPLITEKQFAQRCMVERHICIDTTAAGGNATLLAGSC